MVHGEGGKAGNRHKDQAKNNWYYKAESVDFVLSGFLPLPSIYTYVHFPTTFLGSQEIWPKGQSYHMCIIYYSLCLFIKCCVDLLALWSAEPDSVATPRILAFLSPEV